MHTIFLSTAFSVEFIHAADQHTLINAVA